jgi:hypothetical protein
LRIAGGLIVIVALLGWSATRLSNDPSSLPIRDFVEYYSAGSVYLAGGNPYSGPELVEVQRRVLNKPELDDATMMWNPPWVFAVVAPFAALPVGVAHKLWLLVQILCVFGSVWMLWSVYGGPKGKEWIGWVAAATFPPVLFVVWWGQIGGLVLLGLAGYLYFGTRNRPWIAGLFAALTAIKPHLLFAVGLALVLDALVSKAGRKVVLAGAAAVLAAAVAAWAVHPGIYDLYRSAGWESSSSVNVSPKDWVQPLISYWLRVAIDPSRFGIQFVPTAIVAVGVVVYWWLRRKGWDWKVDMPRLIFASVIACAYGAWLFDLVVLLVPVVQAVTAMESRPARNRALLIGYALVMALAVFFPTLALTPLTGVKVGLQYYVWFAPAILGFYVAARRLARPYNAPGTTTRASSWRTPAADIEWSSSAAGSAASCVPST